MTVDELFLCTLDDLRDRAQLGAGEYDALMMALLLRKLLLDGLIHAVNRPPGRRLKLSFEVVDQEPPPELDQKGNWSPNQFVHPASWDAPPATATLGFDQFVHRTVVVAFGERLEVRDLIRYLANYYGAVHISAADDPKTEAARDLAWGVRVFGPDGTTTSLILSLAGVARVTLDGLEPLRAVIEAHLPLPARLGVTPLGLGRHKDPQARDLVP